MKRRWWLGALVTTAASAVVLTLVVSGATRPRPAGTPRSHLSTARIERTTLQTGVVTPGVLGDAPAGPIVNQLAGTYTALPTPGMTVAPGQVLYRVDNVPDVLLEGSTPAWRAFTPGMTAGPDVEELQAALISLGDATGLIGTPDSTYSWTTVAAVERWQRSLGLTADGQVSFGEIAFLPQPVIAGTLTVALGTPATTGEVPFLVTGTARTVSVPMNPMLPSVSDGETVQIILPTGARTPGSVQSVGPPPPASATGSGTPGSAGSSATTGSTGSQPTAVATISPSDPAATGTVTGEAVQVLLVGQQAADVLAAPVAALLALTGGGYGVEVVEPTGAHRLVGVTTGLFAGARVQVRGHGLRTGTEVVVSQ